MSEGRIWRVGVIGAGKHGSRYARHIVNDVDGFELAAISRRSEEGRALAGQWRCRWHADWQDLINDPTVDCLIAALPPMLNREVAAACALARKPLLLEKPMACTVADAEAIGETFYRTGVPLTIGQTLRYNPVIQAFRDRLAQIGPLLGFSTNQRLEPSPLGWMDDPELAGAGVSHQTAIHVFDALRFITGREIVRVLARTRRVHTRQFEDHLTALLELEGGVLGTVDCSKIGPARSGRFEFTGAGGLLQGDQVHHDCEVVDGNTRLPIDLGGPTPTIAPLLVDWLGFLRSEATNPVPSEEGLAAVRVSAACLRSAAVETWVEV